MNTVIKLAITAAFAVSSISAFAEPAAGKVSALYQPGLTYFPIMHMEKAKLFEAHAAKLGIKDAEAKYTKLGGPGDVINGLLSKAGDVGSLGTPSVPLLAAKSKLGFKVMYNLSYMPMYLNSTNPAIKTLADYLKPENTGKNRIAVPTVKTSVQAVTLQMAAAKEFGADKFSVLDSITQTMPHPDAMGSMLALKTEINNHFTSVPYQEQEIRDSKGQIHKVLSSYDVLGGKTSFVTEVASVEWATKYPKEFQAFKEALAESIDWINSHKDEAAKEYVELSKTKETVADIKALLNDPEIEFNIVPKGLAKYSNFMYSVKTISFAPSYKDMTFSYLHNTAGN